MSKMSFEEQVNYLMGQIAMSLGRGDTKSTVYTIASEMTRQAYNRGYLAATADLEAKRKTKKNS